MSSKLASLWLVRILGADVLFEWDANLRTSSGALRASFFIPARCFIAMFAYAVIFRAGRKPQPTDKEDAPCR